MRLFRKRASISALVALAMACHCPSSTRCMASAEPTAEMEETRDIGARSVQEIAISSCADLDSYTNMHLHHVEVCGDIICDTPKYIHLMEGDQATFSSEDPIHIAGVKFVIDSGATVFFGAPTVTLDKLKGSDEEVFAVAGSLNIFVDTWSTQHALASADDLHGVVRVIGNGTLESDGVIHYTETRIVVAKPTQGVKADDAIAQDPVPSSTTLPSEPKDAVLDRDLADTPSEVVIEAPPDAETLSNPHIDNVLNVGGHSANADVGGHSNHVKYVAPMPYQIYGKGRTRPSHRDPRKSTSVGLWFDKNSATKDSIPDALLPGHRIPRKSIWAGVASSETFTWKDLMFEQLFTWARKPKTHIKVDEPLEWPRVLTSDTGSKLSLGIDGTIRIETPTTKGDDIGDEGGPNIAIVAQSNYAEVMTGRARPSKRGSWFRREEGEDKQTLPLRQHPMLRVTDTGDVEVSVDGVTVISISDPNAKRKRGWIRNKLFRRRRQRKSSANYELHVVTDGFEIRLDGVKVWEMHADAAI